MGGAVWADRDGIIDVLVDLDGFWSSRGRPLTSGTRPRADGQAAHGAEAVVRVASDPLSIPGWDRGRHAAN